MKVFFSQETLPLDIGTFCGEICKQ